MPAPQTFLSFIRKQADQMRKDDRLPKTKAQWLLQKNEVRNQLRDSWGPFPAKPCPLQPRKMGTIDQGEYNIEKLLLQTRPGIWMTANAYVPKKQKGQVPGVLCVHGHWSRAKQDPVVQSRCIGLVKLGFFVLSVDAMGAGERGLKKPLGEYHGEMVASTLWPTGLALSGLQVYENMRAVDYMSRRPEVDSRQMGVTGCSGGGNQTMYVGAYDERLKCVVPTCSVGTYESYLGAACCMCEVVPSAISYTEEWALLAMVAPRALMITNATKDAIQFSVGKGAISLAKAKKVFELFRKAGSVKQTVVDSGHGYNKEMREAMYGFMTKHLKGQGDGKPIAEPTIKTLDPEQLRCFPGKSRPDNYITLTQFAAAEGRKLLAKRPIPTHYEQWDSDSQLMLNGLLDRSLGPMPKRTDFRKQMRVVEQGNVRDMHFSPEAGITLTARHVRNKGKRLAVVVDLDGREAVERGPWLTALQREGYDTVTLDLRATGKNANRGDRIHRAMDHNSAQWSMWIGRPLIGQWVWDITRLLDALSETSGQLVGGSTLIGIGPAANVALATAALDWRFGQVVAVNPLATYVSDKPYATGRAGILAPGILKDVGDVQHYASLITPRLAIIAGGVFGDGKSLTAKEQQEAFKYTRRVYTLEKSSKNLQLLPKVHVPGIVKAMAR